MPIYRTVSDRGLWKKYQRSAQAGQPQHFHKPQYLDKDKPVVSNYSQNCPLLIETIHIMRIRALRGMIVYVFQK